MRIKTTGMFVLGADIPPGLAQQVIESITVYGVLEVSPQIRESLGDKIK